nr:putative RNA-dependent RNA polymerase [Leptosphaeria biglobosa chrysovirus 1]
MKNSNLNRLSQVERKLVKRIDQSMKSISDEFASSKGRVGYTMKVKSSLSRYESGIIPNLYAIVMPAGTGKTHLAEKFGFIDIDKCVAYPEHEKLFRVRRDIIEKSGTWAEHNSEWNSKVRETLSYLDFSRPTVVMCHSEEMAFEIGAIPMVAILLEKKEWEKNISGRTDLGKRFSIMNRMTVEKHTRIVPLRMARTNSGVEKLVIRACTAYGVPVACPMKYDNIRNRHYSDACPDWVLTGDCDGLDVNVLLNLFERGDVPKECMDYFLSSVNMPASYGFGFTMFHWSEYFAKVRYMTNDKKKYTGDWMSVFPYASDREKNRMNINLRRLLDNTDLLDDEVIVDLLSRHVGENNQFVTMLVSWWAGIGRHLECREFVSTLLGIKQSGWKELMQELHQMVRLSRYVMNSELHDEKERQSLMYMECLLGRRMFEVDEEKEIRDRTGRPTTAIHQSYDPVRQVWSVEQYYKDFAFAMEDVHLGMEQKPRDVPIKSFHDMYMRREEWLTKGSLVYNTIPPEFKKYTVGIIDEVKGVVDEMENRHNKKSLFECYDALPMMTENFELLNVTKLVGKLNETGYKDRTLMPGALLHYWVFSYVLQGAEKQVQPGSVRLNAPSDDDLRYTDMKMHAGLCKLLYDWANYNAQHSADEMAMVIRHLGKVVPGGKSYREFCNVIADAMYTMKLVKKDGSMIDLSTGLYSGWRGTTWINTILNGIYLGVGKLNFKRMYKYDCATMVDHGGDDVDQQFSQPEDCYRMMVVMDKIGFEAKKIKQMIGYTSEFFRVTVNRTGAYASPTRGLATFIAGNWEGMGNVDVKERIISIVDMSWKLIRRGVEPSFMSTAAELAITHWAKLKHEIDWVSIPQEVIHGSVECNGMGIPDKDNCVWTLEPPISEISEGKEVIIPGKLAAEDYVAMLDKELRENNISIERWDMLATKIASGAFEVYKDGRIEHLLKYRGRIVDKVKVIEPRWDQPLFNGLMEFEGASKTLRKQMTLLQRYEVVMPYLTVDGRKANKDMMMEALGVTGNPEVLEFKGDVYYRRLVGEPIGKLITDYCKCMVLTECNSLEGAEDDFKTLCYMASEIFDHHV